MLNAPLSLEAVWAPVNVGVPPTNACRDMMALPGGEIRHYGTEVEPLADGSLRPRNVVLRSLDYGLSWKLSAIPADHPGATVQSPWSGDFLTVTGRGDASGRVNLSHFQPAVPDPEKGLWLFRSQRGPDGPFTAEAMEDDLQIQRQPLPLRTRKRWLLPFQQRISELRVVWGVLLSDDDGRSWRKIEAASPPEGELQWPHAGYRWRQPGIEPVVAELPDGRLTALLRTSRDQHYESFSDDGGESWSLPAPSRFYGVATMPNLLTLSDGRLLAIWNNTAPLPEVDHRTQLGGDQPLIDGWWEDVFTNRDALHAAISDDGGRHWRGFRELALNEHRNDSDFRTDVLSCDCLDKSIHQNQALELAPGKIILAYGQSFRCRRLMLFDVGWLYETERRDELTGGLAAWSVQQYVKSIAGGFRGIAGHCSYNRRPGAQLMPHPDRLDREVLLIGRHPDPRLVWEKEGAVWNFPAARQGELHLRLQPVRGTAGLRISLADRWFNPTDPVIDRFACFTLPLIPIPDWEPDVWHDLRIEWNLDEKRATVFAGTRAIPLPPAAVGGDNGLSYLHLQSLAESADPFGVMIESVRFRNTDPSIASSRHSIPEC